MNGFAKVWTSITIKLFGTTSKFKEKDTVQHISGGPLMVVVKVKLATKRDLPSLVSCSWYDREQRESKTGTFNETELRSFDWYNPG